MSALSTAEWKSFLSARLAQEQGEDEKALRTFEELLRAHPNDPHVRSSHAFALERLGRGKEAVADRIAARYSQLAGTLSGANDKPENWSAALSSILSDIEQAEVRGTISNNLVVW